MKRFAYLLTLALAGAVSLNLTASSAGASSNPLTIVYPSHDWQRYEKPPVEVKLRIEGDPRLFRAQLNNKDVTGRFKPLSGVVSAVFTAGDLKHGDNNFEARLGADKVWRSFKVRSLRTDAVAGGPISPGPIAQPGSPGADLWIPIQTRIISGDGTKATDYAIKVGNQVYQAPPLSDGSATGYQILLLDRATLEPIYQNSNVSYPAGDVSRVNGLLGLLPNLKKCGDNGCLLVAQSLQTLGWTLAECPVGVCGNLTTPGFFFSAMGGSPDRDLDVANGRTVNTGYSLIANVGPNGGQSGTGYERLTCNQANDCGPGDWIPTAGGRSAISGALVKDNYDAYTFAYPGRAVFVTGTGDSTTHNTISIRGTPNLGEYGSDDIPNGYGAFHVVVIYRDSLQLVYQNTFNFDQLYSDDPGAWTMTRVLEDVRGHGNYMVLISSIGNLWHGNWPAQWSKVGKAIERLGGTYSVFVSLASGDDYAFVGATDTKYGEGSVEASLVISRATHPAGSSLKKSKLRGVLAQNNRGNYRPILSNLTSPYDQSTIGIVDAVALQPPVPWPDLTGAVGSNNAYHYIGQKAFKVDDIRGSYTSEIVTITQGDVEGVEYDESGCNCSKPEFDAVKSQLVDEAIYVSDIRALKTAIKDMQGLIHGEGNTIIEDAYTEVSSSLQVDKDKSVTPKWLTVVEFFASSVGDGIAITAGPEAKLGFDMLNGLLHTTLSLSNDKLGVSKTSLATTFANLKDRTDEDFNNAETMTGNLFNLILSDWGRIQALGMRITTNQIVWTGTTATTSLRAINLGLKREYFIRFYNELPYVLEHWTNIAEGALPQNLTPICRYYKHGVPSGYCDEWLKAQTETWLALPSSPTGQTPSPTNDQQNYDIYLISKGTDRCNGLPHLVDGSLLQKLFTPIDPTCNSDCPTQLGVYKPYFFLYENRLPLKTDLSHHCSFP
ncbi:MAG: hypothetical protein ACREEM_29080 [Blastocatellia bacterium]